MRCDVAHYANKAGKESHRPEMLDGWNPAILSRNLQFAAQQVLETNISPLAEGSDEAIQ